LSNHEAIHRKWDKTGSHTCWKGPEIWNPKPTRQDLSFDILPDYLSKTFFLHLMTLPPPSRNDPKYEIRNLHVKIFHLIYYITTFLKLLKQIALDDLAPPPRKGPKIWNPLPGMPRSVGRHYDDVIHPVMWLWRRCTSRLRRCYGSRTLVFPLLSENVSI
jgi:hypothetical protein